MLPSPVTDRTVTARWMRRFVQALALALLLAAAAIAAWQIQRWRDREEEVRLRETHTLTGTVERHPDFRSALLAATRLVWVYLRRTKRWSGSPGRAASSR